MCSFVVIHGMLVGELFPYDHKLPKVGGATPVCANSIEYPHDPCLPIGRIDRAG